MTSPIPIPSSKLSLASKVRADIPASIVVFLVAVPLSLGIAAASGAPVAAGLFAAAIGGILAGYFGGSPLQVSGPAAGLTVIVASLIDQFSWPIVCAITLGAGLLQILLSLSKVARVALAISPVVVNAMLAGIGITIILQQLQVLLGASARSSALENLAALPENLLHFHLHDVLCGSAVIAIILLWAKLPAGIRKIPSQLVAIVAVTLITVVIQADVVRVSIGESILEGITLPQLPSNQWGAFFLGILTVGTVASVESLLSAVAVDRLHRGERTNFDKELLGQGIANAASGAIGGLPVTGVIVRSSTNVIAGAVSRLSAILHGVWVLFFSLLGVALIEEIPVAALAGLLIYTGGKLIRWADISIAHRTGDLLVYLVTVLAVVSLNLLEGVGIGIALSILILLWRVIKASVHAEKISSRRWRLVIEGSCSFLSTPLLVKVLQSIPDDADVVVEFEVDYLDRHVYQAFSDWRSRHEALGNKVVIERREHTLFEGLDQAPPRRSKLHTFFKGSHAPWEKQSHDLPEITPENSHLQHLLPIFAGIEQFHRKHSRSVREHFAPLALTQKPSAMFLTCVDSRVVPNMITNSGPGDLLTLRNVGNMLPFTQQEDSQGAGPGATPDISVNAAITFGVESLDIPAIVLCGHSSCGAISALLTGVPQPQELDQWLTYGQEALQAYRQGHPLVALAKKAGYTESDQLAILNVAIQVERLRQHPSVAARLADGRINVTGLFFDVAASRTYEITSDAILDINDERLLGRTTSQPVDA